jgi:hypothetical protein
MKIRQELNRKAPARLALKDVFHAVTQVLDSEAVAAAGGLIPPLKKRRKKRRHNNNDSEQPETPTSVSPSQLQPQAAEETEIPS